MASSTSSSKEPEGTDVDDMREELVKKYPERLLHMTAGAVMEMPLMDLKIKLVIESFEIYRTVALNREHGVTAYMNLRQLCVWRDIEEWELGMMLPLPPYATAYR